MSPCYRTFWLDTDEQGCEGICLSRLSQRDHRSPSGSTLYRNRSVAALDDWESKRAFDLPRWNRLHSVAIPRGSHLIWIHHVLPLVPPVINSLWCRNCVGPYLGVQSTTLSRLVLPFAPRGVRIVTVVPCILALHGSTGVTLSL